MLSLILLLALVAAQRLGQGLLSVSWLIMLYIILLYLGSLHFYFVKGHYTLVFVFFMAIFYLLGVCLANVYKNFSRKSAANRPLILYTPVDSSILKLSLLGLYLSAVSLGIYRLYKFGIPLFDRTWYTTGLESTIGISNRLLFSFGVENLIVMSLLSLALYKSEKKASYKYITLMAFVSYLLLQILVSGKANAVMPVLIMGMAIYYSDRRLPKKLAFSGTLFILVLVLFIGTFWTNTFSLTEIGKLFFVRLTSTAAESLDFLLYGWSQSHSYELGNTFFLELKRFIAQLGLISKEPLFNEVISNLSSGASISRITGVSVETTLFGIGYANFGIMGAVLSALFFGFIVQRINIYLQLCHTMNIFSFALWIYFVYKLLGFVRSGHVFISFEDYLIGVVPAFTLILIGYIFLALPFPAHLKWKRPSPSQLVEV